MVFHERSGQLSFWLKQALRIPGCVRLEVFHGASHFIIKNITETETQGSEFDKINNGAHNPALRSTDYDTFWASENTGTN